jgi:N6-adenosine-specific RNA methylase IME4/ParB-like chromosome segregation protein Spo0J
MTRPIASIRTGQRHRRDMGDVDTLAASIKAIGLLHPVVVTPDGVLIAGERRLQACRQLGWTDVPVHVVDIDAIVRGELAENAYRKDFTPSELVAIAATVEQRERELARQRMSEGGKVGKLSTPSDAGKTRDRIAAPLGVSGRTLERAQAVVEAAQEDPETFGKLRDDMDRTGRINGIYKRVKIIKQATQIRKEVPPLPGHGPYRVIVADPPWPYEVRDEDPSHRGARPYPTMAIADICAMNVRNIAHSDSILWLWVTNHHMRQAFEVLDTWGFEQKTILTWAKNKMGNGDWLRGQTEHCILAIRGRPVVHLTNQTTLLPAPARGHSVKPIEFYDLVESLCPAPRYAYLFSRYRHNDKWDCHGDEVPARQLNKCADTGNY